MLWALGGRRTQTTEQKIHTIVKNVKIMDFGAYILNHHHEKCIQISTNMPRSIICETDFEIEKIREKEEKFFCKVIHNWPRTKTYIYHTDGYRPIHIEPIYFISL